MDSKNAIEFNQENGIRIGKKQQEIIVYFALLIDFSRSESFCFNTITVKEDFLLWLSFTREDFTYENYLTELFLPNYICKIASCI